MHPQCPIQPTWPVGSNRGTGSEKATTPAMSSWAASRQTRARNHDSPFASTLSASTKWPSSTASGRGDVTAGVVRHGLERGEAVGPGGGVAERGDRQVREAAYLRGEFRLELRVEARLSAPPTLGGAWPARGETGLVSHMASLTSTISSTWAMNCL